MDSQKIFFLILIATWAYSCTSTKKVNNDTPRKIDFGQYRTFSLADAIVVSSRNPVFSWPQFTERVKREISFSLAGKSLERVPRAADLNIYFYAIVKANQQQPLFSYSIGWAAEPFVSHGELFSSYTSNTFVIDFVDSNTHQLIWRGSTSLPFDNQEELYQILAQKVYTLLRRYPNYPS